MRALPVPHAPDDVGQGAADEAGRQQVQTGDQVEKYRPKHDTEHNGQPIRQSHSGGNQ